MVSYCKSISIVLFCLAWFGFTERVYVGGKAEGGGQNLKQAPC